MCVCVCDNMKKKQIGGLSTLLNTGFVFDEVFFCCCFFKSHSTIIHWRWVADSVIVNFEACLHILIHYMRVVCNGA